MSATVIRGDLKPKGCEVPIFQLLQWKYALRIETKTGLHHSKGNVRLHVCRKLGLPLDLTKQSVIEEIQKILDRGVE
jgi:hypothetical protein